jgi:porphobilinogen synthase
MSRPPALELAQRPRRLRRSAARRLMVEETVLRPADFIAPLFVVEGDAPPEEIASMPGVFRLNVADLIRECRELHALGIPAVALFPKLDPARKDDNGTEALNPETLVLRAVRAVKAALPDLVVITDVALDPYTSHGHDGILDESGYIVNDITVEVLAKMAIAQARAGCDMVAPSDMMDGRIGAIRDALDEEGFTNVCIMAYSAKYASAYYGPFRDALGSAPKSGDKKTYQMNPANSTEAILEVELDITEGADIVMVKPALPYLDIISKVRDVSAVPVAAYNVSGEYAMIKAAGEKGWIDEKKVMMETLLSIKRAGADLILTYFAKEVALLLK